MQTIKVMDKQGVIYTVNSGNNDSVILSTERKTITLTRNEYIKNTNDGKFE